VSRPPERLCRGPERRGHQRNPVFNWHYGIDFDERIFAIRKPDSTNATLARVSLIRDVPRAVSRGGRAHRECAHRFLTLKTHEGGRLVRHARDAEYSFGPFFVWSLHGTRVAINTIR
jgi:hypothetical protein